MQQKMLHCGNNAEFRLSMMQETHGFQKTAAYPA